MSFELHFIPQKMHTTKTILVTSATAIALATFTVLAAVEFLFRGGAAMLNDTGLDRED